MVLTLPSLRSSALTWTPRFAMWLVLAAILAWFAVVYTADGLPSPYGLCYESRGRPMPCADAPTAPQLSQEVIARSNPPATP